MESIPENFAKSADDSLQIKNFTEALAGVYRCQVNNKMVSHFVKLKGKNGLSFGVLDFSLAYSRVNSRISRQIRVIYLIRVFNVS